MSVADHRGVVHQATSVDKWRTILDAVIDNVTACVIRGNGAGGVLFANGMCCSAVDLEQLDQILIWFSEGPPRAKVVYIYAQGSMFENLMNFYMSSYVRGLDPNEPAPFLSRSTVVNSSVTAG